MTARTMIFCGGAKAMNEAGAWSQLGCKVCSTSSAASTSKTITIIRGSHMGAPSGNRFFRRQSVVVFPPPQFFAGEGDHAKHGGGGFQCVAVGPAPPPPPFGRSPSPAARGRIFAAL